jgi:hypothetical protein
VSAPALSTLEPWQAASWATTTVAAKNNALAGVLPATPLGVAGVAQIFSP